MKTLSPLLASATCLGLLLTGTVTALPAPQADPNPATAVRSVAGDLELTLARTPSGLRLASLFDLKQGQELLATNALPLFSVTLRRAGSTSEIQLTAEAGWEETSLLRTPNGLEVRCSKPQDEALRGLAVTASAAPESRRNAWRWHLRMANASHEWSIWRVRFPQIALADLGEGAAVLFPRGPGEVQRSVWQRPFSYRGNYPGGWCAMQFMAAYREGDKPTGAYFGVHDPWGSTKDLALESDPATRSVRLRFEHPAPDMGKADNDFELSGEAVWQLLRGDWFDAAMIYRAWARREARWWPRLGADGRADTPQWMRELNAWAMTGGGPEQCVGPVQGFQRFLGVPIGFHWYNWHEIPFDNDYPHYFPAKPGFTQGVAALQQAQVFVMPYINGRLWDARDRGVEDFEFSKRALAAATKKEDGQPYLESYGSKETNGQPVRLAAMCPGTPLWRHTVRDLVLKLTREVGTRAVYIDQVAAAAPTLCFDPSHGHPLGGGHWWNEGYWVMLRTIRRELPRGAVLTTECNGEPFVRWFDGYLTWHWQHDGQVPAFPAVYGGAVQMFGRAYRSGATKDLALRMKAGQQLVFGEQLGWIDPALVKENDNAEFFRQVVQLRAKLNRYFAAGEMARPPRLLGPVPTVRADWQWSGEWWVTTDAVLTGAWQLPAEKRIALLFVNVSDQSVTAKLSPETAAPGVSPRRVRAQSITPVGPDAGTQDWLAIVERPMTFLPRKAVAWELTW
jgi:hypothetical protein